MWPRFVEMVLGLWLLSSVAVWPDAGHGIGPVNAVAGLAVIVLALVSFNRRLRAAHVGNILVAVFLIAWGWSAFPRPGPAAAQNQILTGLVLALVAFAPSESGKPPPGWRKYVAGRDVQG
ncbi:MAG TPA: hypothetical protein VJ997_00105 [Longimicrobiales bacterium]|nr:hypothetical protein [Longimicrobiales bacterium]